MAFDDQSSSQIIRTDAVDPFISLRVIGNDRNEMTFRVKKTKPLQKLMEIYSERNGLSIGTLRFLYDGFRIKNDDTPESLEMENGDAIDVMVEQTGGGF
ncbi:small ubiquitin-related modifier [Rhizophagus irregularis]|uniref:Small ubiquitin-related modifier n=4 Tax=Rhizophagus irregularis TaxID=588596 RepID=A0A2I1F4X9_9GLOM|nr:SUMO family protein SMT3 [Rhizophagus irregularis DAOM 197198w]PKC14219.1 small ubiquitin-related modifier [Rhizophagus irregularis]RGB28550.1 small ubiquitin-related modifier [Rhizophagus diaphanus] [Rhizophagus sp. MUCL 43196]GBC53964.1 small ubiquitin-related modifier-like [Rhizophagus irregularis DAOM 181602=DAOM 197198]PKC59246.1 small ubiquitin-related modifier [Rhizophagus irregularis]